MTLDVTKKEFERGNLAPRSQWHSNGGDVKVKKYFNKKTVISTALLAALLAVLIIIPLSAGAGDNPGEGSIPIPDSYDINSDGQETENPAELADGQIWVNKNVVDNEDGTFDITLFVWGRMYADEDGETQLPLDPDFPDVTITDMIGDDFAYNEDAVYYAGAFTAGDDGAVVWVVPQDDILDGAQSCVFTVTLKKGWEVDTKYYTNVGAAAHFTPAYGNTYYYKTTTWTETVVNELRINWNHGVGNGLNSFAITDADLGVTIESRNFNANTDVTVRFDGQPPETYKFNPEYYSYSSAYIEPENASDGEWGFFWEREEGKFKTLLFWFKGLEGPGFVTCYGFDPGNNGGNEPIMTDEVTNEYSKTEKIAEHPWADDSKIEKTLPNRGVIEISVITIIVYKEITGDEFTGTRPAFEFGLFDNEGCEGDPVATAVLAGSAEDMRAVFQFGLSSILEYFGEGDEEAVFWIKEIAGAESANSGTWKYDGQIVEVRIGIDGNVTFAAEVEEGEDYPVFVNDFKKSEVITSSDPSPRPSPDPVTSYNPIRTVTPPVISQTPAVTPVDIIDYDPPLGDMPAEDPIPDVVVTVDLADDAVPLGDMPQTGIESTLTIWIAGICVSMLLTGLIARLIFRRKKEA